MPRTPKLKEMGVKCPSCSSYSLRNISLQGNALFKLTNCWPKICSSVFSESQTRVQKQQDYSHSTVTPRKDAPTKVFWKPPTPHKACEYIRIFKGWRAVWLLLSRGNSSRISNHDKWVTHRARKHQTWILNYFRLGKNTPWCVLKAACTNKTGHDNRRESTAALNRSQDLPGNVLGWNQTTLQAFSTFNFKESLKTQFLS